MKAFVYTIARKSPFLFLTPILVAVFYLGNSANALSLDAEGCDILDCDCWEKVSNNAYQLCLRRTGGEERKGGVRKPR